MRWLHAARARLGSVFLRRTLEKQLETDLQFHLEQETAENIRAGLPPHEAVRLARIALGSLESPKEACRDMRRVPIVETLARDLRYALRSLRKSPTFALATVATLALGVGANTAIFSMLYTAILRPVSYPDPARLAILSCTVTIPGRAPNSAGWSYPKFTDLRRLTTTFESIEGFSRWDMNLTGPGDAERVNGEIVTGGYFAALGVPAIRGRTILPADDELRAPAVAMISEALWRTKFSADEEIVGRSVGLASLPFTIIGVAPAGFRGESSRADIWVPVAQSPALMANPTRLQQRMAHWLVAVARLRPDTTIAQADQDLKNTVRAMEIAQPSGEVRRGVSATWSGTAVPILDAKVDPLLKKALIVLVGAVGFVLLITCLNLANILLGRTLVRQQEIAVRVALGASRMVIFRQVLTESVLLGLLGGALGLVVAISAIRLFGVLQPPAQPGLAPFVTGLNLTAIDIRQPAVIVFTLLLAVAAGVCFGLIPALQASRVDLVQVLKDENRGSTRRPAHGGLLIGQVALAVVLLVGAGLMLRSLTRMLAIDVGFDPRNVVTFRLDLPAARYDDDARRLLFEDITAAVRAVPGVQAVSVASTIPLRGQSEVTRVIADGDLHINEVGIHMVGPQYFIALGLPLRRGRLLSEQDGTSSPRVAIINESAARRHWPGENPVGHRLTFGLNGWGGPGEEAEIIGVVGDARYQLIDMPPGNDVYLAYRQRVPTSTYFVVRAWSKPSLLVPAIRRAIGARDRSVPIYDAATMDQVLAGSSGRLRFSSVLLTAFAGLALMLAAAGIYGTLACAVATRTREIGLRIALGAPRSTVARLVLGNLSILCAVGLALGLVGSVAASRLLIGLVYEIALIDPPTILAAIGLVLGTAMAAAAVPVFRAIRLDPIVALRRE